VDKDTEAVMVVAVVRDVVQPAVVAATEAVEEEEEDNLLLSTEALINI
jgi:hypothetical protein